MCGEDGERVHVHRFQEALAERLSVAAAAWGARPDVVLGVAAVAGVAKEAYDAATGRGHVGWLGSVFTALGGAVVAGAVLARR